MSFHYEPLPHYEAHSSTSACGGCPPAQGTAPGHPRAVPSPGHRSGAHAGGALWPRAPLWGTKWEEVLLGRPHADKLEAVIIVKISYQVFDDPKSAASL